MQKFNKASYGDLIADALSQVLTTVIKRVVVDRGIRYARAKFDDRFNMSEIDDAIEDEEFNKKDPMLKKDYEVMRNAVGRTKGF